MIPATSNFQAALASFLRGATTPSIGYIVEIENYHRMFTNAAGVYDIPFFDAPAGELTRLTTSSLAGVYGPDLTFDYSPAGAYGVPGSDSLLSPTGVPVPPRSAITKVYAVVRALATSGVNTAGGSIDPLFECAVSLDGGSTWTELFSLFAPFGTQNYLVDITSLLGTIASFDFTQVEFRVTQADSLSNTGVSPAELTVDALGLLFAYTPSLNEVYLMLANAGTVYPAWTSPAWPPQTPDGSDYGTATLALTADQSQLVYIDQWLVSPWPEDLEQTVNDLEGGADTTNLIFNVQDGNVATGTKGAITGDFPNFIFEGQRVILKTFFPGMEPQDFCTIWTGFVDTVSSDNNNMEYQFSCLDTSIKLAQVIYQAAAGTAGGLTSGDGGPTSSTNICTVQGNPMAILLDILLNQLTNPDGSIGLDPSLIDTTTIQNYMNGPFAGLEFVFHVSDPPSAHEFIKAQIMKPLGGYLFVNALGQVTVAFFYPLAGATPAMTLGPGNWTSIPTAEQTDMVNTVEFQFDRDDATANSTGDYDSDVVEEYEPSIAKYGIYGEQVIQADGLRSAFLGFLIATFVSWLIFFRYGFKNLKFDQYAAESIWQTMRLETGDVVAVTHPQIPDRAAGVMGITNKLFQVLDKKWNLTEGKVTLTMIDASYLSTFGFFEIAPNGEGDYTAVSSSDQATYMFESEAGKYSNGNPANILG